MSEETQPKQRQCPTCGRSGDSIFPTWSFKSRKEGAVSINYKDELARMTAKSKEQEKEIERLTN